MCWRQVTKLQKVSLIVLFYLIVYMLIRYAMTPKTEMYFVEEELRVGSKYALMFVVSPHTPAFSDADGAGVFASRRCGKCFVTNNRGFLPMSEYDAILFYGKVSTLSESPAFMEPGKRYFIDTSKRCVSSKFSKCRREPVITSFGSEESFDLCSLCEDLIKKRLRDQIEV